MAASQKCCGVRLACVRAPAVGGRGHGEERERRLGLELAAPAPAAGNLRSAESSSAVRALIRIDSWAPASASSGRVVTSSCGPGNRAPIESGFNGILRIERWLRARNRAREWSVDASRRSSGTKVERALRLKSPRNIGRYHRLAAT
ncbi:MAG: hypothetical protein ACRDL7_05040 [Gaiellaceae bacterium]